MTIHKSTIKVLAEALKNDHDHPQPGATVLIGSGVSVSAGIPAAHGIIAEIQRRFSARVAHQKPTTYNEHMAILNPNERKRLINDYVKNAKINWAHLALAQLIAGGYVTRVLTTNFDPLVSRACALINEFPAIYDYANPPRRFDNRMLPDKAVFHLHGQHTGFVLRNTAAEVQEYSDRIGDLLRDSTQGRPMIVVGYSGDCDPVFERLVQLDFDNSLYWVPFRDMPVAEVVRDQLLSKADTSEIPGYDADGFFSELAKALNCFPPTLVQRPFSHLKRMLETVGDYVPHGQNAPLPILGPTFDALDSAFEDYEVGTSELPSEMTLWVRIMLDEHESVAESFQVHSNDISLNYRVIAASAWCNWGSALAEEARGATNSEVARILEQACEKFETALHFISDFSNALYNWGNALAGMAKLASGDESRRLLEQACEKYKGAVASQPDMHDALHNWGCAYYEIAKLASDDEAKSFFGRACEKYEAALQIQPDLQFTLNNWGNSLAKMARLVSRDEAKALLEQAYEKYEAALQIQPELSIVINNWGNALAVMAALNSGDEAKKLFEAAYEKFDSALYIEPSLHEALLNSGDSLRAIAQLSSSAEAKGLLEKSCDRYEAALKISPDRHDTSDNLGVALLSLAAIESDPAEHSRLLGEARGHFEHTEALKEGEGAYNLACIASLLAEPNVAREWLEKAKAAGTLPDRAHLESDTDLDPLLGLDWFQSLLDSVD